MSLFKKLFGGGAASEPETTKEQPVDHNGFLITPDPIKEGSQFRVAARIEKEINGEVKVHDLVRADTTGSLDEAKEISLRKACQMIDEQGDRLFG